MVGGRPEASPSYRESIRIMLRKNVWMLRTWLAACLTYEEACLCVFLTSYNEPVRLISCYKKYIARTRLHSHHRPYRVPHH